LEAIALNLMDMRYLAQIRITRLLSLVAKNGRRFGAVHRNQIGILLLSVTCLSACAASEAEAPRAAAGKRPVPVVVVAAAQKTVPVLVQATGTVEAYSTVSVKSQIGGQLTGVYFKQGQTVKKGDLLFTIDSRPLEATLAQAEAAKAKDVALVKQAQANVAKAVAQVKQAEATVAKDVAQFRNADVQAQRYSGLQAQGVVSQEQADQFQTDAAAQQATVSADQQAVANAEAAVGAAQADVQSAQAAVVADEAAIANAKVQLSYSEIYSPIDGQTGTLELNQGNLVKSDDDNPLVTISQIRPIYVNFAIPQRLLPDLKKYSASHKLEVDVLPAKDQSHPIRGELTFIDSGVNVQTGTIQLKGTFSNEQAQLSPGQFVSVVLKLTEQPNVITVPAQAVQTGQKGKFVFVVKPDKTVEVRDITVGDTLTNETVIEKGLKSGETVVTDGQFNLTPGATVQVKSASENGATGNQKPGE
jgi:multidrug efflux system membrane fusion protein